MIGRFTNGCKAALAGLIALGAFYASAHSIKAPAQMNSSSLWSHDNLVAWCTLPFDSLKRNSEERAQMLERLGFKHFAYDWRQKDVPTFDREIEAMQEHHIDLMGWWWPLNADDPLAKSTLETFKRHNVHPQLWVAQGPGRKDPPKTVAEQVERVNQEADRINALVKLAAPYGSKVELYNHNGWFGMMDNELAVLDRLKTMGVTDVGLVYSFSHGRDKDHDDSANFPAIWQKIEPYVVTVNITGSTVDPARIYPSQGDRELPMMRTIEESGWKGLIGLIGEKGGDNEVTLKNYIVGLDWLAAELNKPGSGGPAPFPAVQ